jgi:hypothetical protein
VISTKEVKYRMVKDFFIHNKNRDTTNDNRLPSLTSPLITEDEMQKMIKVRARFVQSDKVKREEVNQKKENKDFD